MTPNLDSIKDFLARLDLSTSRIPTMTEYKKAYREKLKNHPDKGGDTSVFQGITEAAMAIWKFMTENQGHQHRSESEKDAALLKNFESSNTVNYNKGSVVFDIDGDKAQLWIDSLQKRLSPPVPLSDGSGVRMKVDQYKIPLVTCKTKQEYGSLSVTVYPSPKTSNPKIMVQGQAYLAFVTLVLPEVFKDMLTPRLSLDTITTTVQSTPMSDYDSDTDSQQVGQMIPTNVHQALHRLELEMVNTRNSLGAKVDAAIVNTTRLNTQGLVTKVEALEQIMAANLKKTDELEKAVTGLSASINANMGNINIDPSQIETLASCVSNHPTLSQLSTTLADLRSEVAQSTTLLLVQSEVQNVSNNLVTLESEIKNISQKIVDTNEASNKDMAQIRKNSDDSLGMFDAMKKSLDILAKQAVNPGLTSTTTTQSQSKSNPNMSADGDKIPEDPVTKTRKGIMFTDSIALDIDTAKLKQTLCCDLKIIQTNFIHHQPSSTNPDAYLQCMVSRHLAGQAEFDFVILAVGTHDITELDINNSPSATLTNTVAEQTKTLVEVAETLAIENNIDVLLVDKPPRYDTIQSDPMGTLAKLSRYSNGVLASNVGMTPRLFIVDQSSLARSAIKARSDIYKPDGLHLTAKGLTFYLNNISKALIDCYGDISVPKPSTNQEQGGARQSDNSSSSNRHDRRQGRGDRRDRPHQEWLGYGYPGGQLYRPPPPYPEYPPPPPGWNRGGAGGGSWGGARQRHRRPDMNWGYNSHSEYSGSGGYNRGYGRRN